MVDKISLLGSTGSIGVQTLEVARYFGIRVLAMSCGRNIELLKKQIVEFKPVLISVELETDALEVKNFVRSKGLTTDVLFGQQGNLAVATVPGASMTVAAMVGIAGLEPVLAAIRSGKDIALANKETLVAGGSLVMMEARKMGVNLYPVDSEHSAIWQCLTDNKTDNINRIFLTASGGPFRGKSADFLINVTVDDALAHPTWKMGAKITIDSATLMNKGLEVIEAHWLFDIPVEKIEVVVHPQSIIHSMVEFSDGSVLAQMGFPDMKLPIQIALARKERASGEYKKFNPYISAELTFEKPDTDVFKCLELAYVASRIGKSMPTVLNSANESAVESFLAGRIRFDQIPVIIETTMNMHEQNGLRDIYTYEDIRMTDIWAREASAQVSQKLKKF